MNMVRTDPIKPGSASPVMVGEDKMLDEEMNSRTPGAGRPGTDGNPSRAEDD